MSGMGSAAKYALVAAGAFVLVVGIGLFSAARNDERRLAQLEAELQGRQLPPTQARPTQAPPTQVSNSPGETQYLPLSDGVGSHSLPEAAQGQTPNQLALGGAAGPAADVVPPSAGSQDMPQPSAEPGPTDNADVEQPAAVESATAVNTTDVNTTANTPPPTDGWLHASQLISEDIDAPSTPSWFASLESSESAETAAPVCSADRSLRTALVWAKSPAEAAQQARQEGKLVFIIHVSGNFEDPGFT